MAHADARHRPELELPSAPHRPELELSAAPEPVRGAPRHPTPEEP